MYQIQQITDNASQTQKLALADGSLITFTLRFVPMQYAWVIDELAYGDFTLNGLRISNSPNMLRQYRNQIPFGIGCFSTNNREPSLQEDFASQASELYLLTADDVAAYEEYLANGS